MKNNRKGIVPVFLGGGLCAYSAALAFREKYGVISYVYTERADRIFYKSKFIKVRICKELFDDEIAVSELLKFASSHADGEMYLIPCEDAYVRFLLKSKNILSCFYNIQLPDIHLTKRLLDKSHFYSEMKSFGIPYPEYVAVEKSEFPARAKLSNIGFPAVVKPADSEEYFSHRFKGMQKVYFVKSLNEAERIIHTIFSHGYGGKLIFQRKVGNFHSSSVLTTFSDGNGCVVRAALGKVILADPCPLSFGNYNAIVIRPLDSVSFKLIDYLNQIGYKGFANFDITEEKNEKYALEINPRLGRSCDYLRAAKINIAELLVLTKEGCFIPPNFNCSEAYWHYPSHSLVMKHVLTDYKNDAVRLHLLGREFSPDKNSQEGTVYRMLASARNAVLDKRLERAMFNLKYIK